MDRSVQLIMHMFLKSLKEMNLVFMVTTQGDFIFMDATTEDKVAVTKADILQAWDRL